jgi:hypothetical protein
VAGRNAFAPCGLWLLACGFSALYGIICTNFVRGGCVVSKTVIRTFATSPASLCCQAEVPRALGGSFALLGSTRNCRHRNRSLTQMCAGRKIHQKKSNSLKNPYSSRVRWGNALFAIPRTPIPSGTSEQRNRLAKSTSPLTGRNREVLGADGLVGYASGRSISRSRTTCGYICCS